ncbi:hypothetical protein DB347_24545 [Opitutaceae bacterium EW11]|nr:hypothetical protein DB347_24545 [Opitutaceae bacterium EW11]
MILCFGPFSLEEAKRELRLSGELIELQPRVFDLFVHLVRNRERVVPKEELLSAIWPEVIVTDSSIMRAISVIRAALRRGGLEDAIQTYSRQGYRFVANVGPYPIQAEAEDRVGAARAAATQGRWKEALDLYRAIPDPSPLGALDHEHWANAVLYAGQPRSALEPLERAVALYLQGDHTVDAARVALMLANVHLEDRAAAVAKGWHARAGSFLAGIEGETREHGLHRWLSARIALFEGDLDRALHEAEHAEALAHRIKDPDVEALGLIYRAHVELATGAVRTALMHMDEAGAATLAGAVSPWVSGFVFCSIIWAHLDRGDLGRAGQWTDQFTRWIEKNRGFGFPGLCRLHRGEVLCAQGELAAAESEISRARELLSGSARYAEGDAWRVLGEIHLLRGECEAAEEAFQRAHELGWHPLPGWALLQSERGDRSAALKALQRGLQTPNWADGQRRGILLAHAASIAARAGKLQLAEEMRSELERAVDLRSASSCEALFLQACAEVAFAKEETEIAVRRLREALAAWLDAGSRINVAHTRLRLAEMLFACRDRSEAMLELASAETAFAKMHAALMVERCKTVRLRHAE